MASGIKGFWNVVTALLSGKNPQMDYNKVQSLCRWLSVRDDHVKGIAQQRGNVVICDDDDLLVLIPPRCYHDTRYVASPIPITTTMRIAPSLRLLLL